jgi:flagellar biosynthesis activator protein FlaF
MFSNAQQAYDVGRKTSQSSRELEAAALFKAARNLEACRLEWKAPGNDERLGEALRQNMKLWTFFQGELTRPDHEMPVELRHNLLRLSAFVDRRTFELMAHPQPEKLQALIEINRQIASGLAVTPA